jgi:hypothetical protein
LLVWESAPASWGPRLPDRPPEMVGAAAVSGDVAFGVP